MFTHSKSAFPSSLCAISFLIALSAAAFADDSGSRLAGLGGEPRALSAPNFHRVFYTDENLNDAHYDAATNLYSAVGFNGLLLLSSNGQQFSQNIVAPDLNLYGIDQSGEYLGVSGNNHFSTQSIAAVFDLIEPIDPTGILAISSEFVMANIATNDSGVWVVVGGRFTIADGWSSMIWRSTDNGQNWSALRINGTSGLLHVTHEAGHFVAVGHDGFVATSTDGSSWSFDFVNSATLNSVTFGAGKWIIVGSLNEIYVANFLPTGWVTIPLNGDPLFDIHYANNCFLAVGAFGRASVSSDGITWSEFSSGSTMPLEGITFGSRGWFGVGNDGLIVISNPLDSIAPDLIAMMPETDETIAITFSEQMDMTSALNPSNYVVSGPGVGSVQSNPLSVELIAGRDGSPSEYRLSWSGGQMISGESISIEVAGVKDNFNNLISGNNSLSSIAVPVALSLFEIE